MQSGLWIEVVVKLLDCRGCSVAAELHGLLLVGMPRTSSAGGEASRVRCPVVGGALTEVRRHAVCVWTFGARLVGASALRHVGAAKGTGRCGGRGRADGR